MIYSQQIALFDLNTRKKSNTLDREEPSENKKELVKPKLINPFFFLGLKVFVDLIDESQTKIAQCVLKITGANIITDPTSIEKIFEADIIVTDKDLYKNHLVLTSQRSGIGESLIETNLGFKNQRNQISTSYKKMKSVIVSPEQIPWAFITKPLQNEMDRNTDEVLTQNSLGDASIQLPPSQIPQHYISPPIENPPIVNLNNFSEKNKNSSFIGKKETQSKSERLNSSSVSSSPSLNKPSSNGGLIVVADSTMRTAPNFCLFDQMPQIRAKPLPEGVHLISPFVSDENISKLCNEKPESLLANSNISHKVNVSIKQSTKKKKTKKDSRSKAAACRYCGICKKSIADEEKHRKSLEHKQNVSKQFLQVDEMINSFPNFSFI